MSNVLVLGVGPLPIDPTERLHAPGIRVWHLANVIYRQGHSVVLGIIEFGDFRDNPEAASRPRQESVGDRFSVCRFHYHSQRTPTAIATLHERCKFHCIVSTTDIMNDAAARVPVRLPLWLDYLGDPLCERQLQAATFDNDASLLDLWRVMLEALLHGDHFSVASTPQKYTLIGQLGLAGRLNQFTAAHDLVSVIPNSARGILGQSGAQRRLIKGFLIPAESFLLLWAGGYNTWTDPETLFHGLELAMRRDADIYFVSVGGEIPGHDNVTFKRFREMCEASDLRSHFVFIGWVPPSEMPNYYMQADAAINIDLPCYEAEIGTRTRLVDWIDYEIPVVTTALCEPAKILAERKLVESFEPASPKSLADALVRLKEHHEEAKVRAQKARTFLDELFDEKRDFAPLLEWVANPTLAPDRRVSDPGVASRSLDVLFPDCEVAYKNAELLRRFCGVAGRKGGPSATTSFWQRVKRRFWGRHNN
ncbi:MAG: glycosyltransferase [Candidatus Sumerlaeaceae bacterium]